MGSQNDIIAKIESNWKTFEGLVTTKLVGQPELQPGLTKFLNAEKSRIMTCPASTRTDYHGAFPGGLVDHSLRVVKLMSELNKAYGVELAPKSILVTGLFHDVGKIGSEKFDYYLEKESDWHNKQGIMYEINQKVSGASPSMRSLWWLNKYGVQLSEEEFLAISSIKDRVDNTNDSVPNNNESMLTVVLQQAVKVACLRGRGKNSVIEK